jgi:hypothetical protein
MPSGDDPMGAERFSDKIMRKRAALAPLVDLAAAMPRHQLS